MLSRLLIVVAGLGGVGFVTVDAVQRCVPRIQEQIRGSVALALEADGIASLDVAADGRDVLVRGTVATGEVAKRALSVADSIPGVRRVADGIAVAPAPAPEPAVAPVPPDDRFGFRVVRFETASDALTAEGRAVLDDLVRAVRRIDDRVLHVDGHADACGEEGYNQALSMRRADCVVAYLRSRLPRVDVRAAAFGESRPVADNATDDGRRRNRRVEIRFLEENSR